MRECCAKPENRSEPVELKTDLTVSTCTECGAKHYELTADPLELNLTGTGIA
jgi:hypothetical protein